MILWEFNGGIIMKKVLLIILSVLFLLCAGLAVGCSNGCGNGKEPTLPEEQKQVFKLQTSTKTLFIGQQFTIKVTGVDQTESVAFESKNQSVATVDQFGVVTALSLGEATITVTVGENSKNCYVKVVEDSRVPTITFDNVAKQDGVYVLPMSTGDQYQIDYSMYFGGEKVTGEVTYESANSDVITVSPTGLVTAVAQGNANGVIKVNASFSGGYQDQLYTEITVVVTNAKWSLSLDSEDAIYPLDSYDGVSYKNTVGYSVALTVGGQTVDASQISVTAETEHFEINGNQITAKRAGTGLITFSYQDGQDVYEKYLSIDVERIVIDNGTSTDDQAIVFVKAEDVASISRFNQFADDRQTEQVYTITNGFKTQVTVKDGKYFGVSNGVSLVEIQNDIFSVLVQLHFVDYYIGRSPSVLYQYIIEKDADGEEIYEQQMVLPKLFNEECVQTLYFYREGGLYTEGGIKQQFRVTGFDVETNTLTFNKTVYRDDYWFWYTGEVKYVIVTDTAHYIGEIKISREAKEPVPDVSQSTLYKGDLYQGEVAYLEKTGEGETMTFTLPQSFGNVSNVKILGSIATEYDASSRTVTVNKADLSRINGGVKTVTFENENGKGYFNVTIAEYVLRTDEDVVKLANTNENYYIVIANDLDGSVVGGITPSYWQTTYSGTIDGKGHIVSNIVLENTWWGFIYQYFYGTIKNVAFVNMQNTSGAVRGILSHHADGATLENFYISGTAYREHLFETVLDNGVTLTNTILNFHDGWGEKGIVSRNVDGLSTGEITYGENFYNIYNDDSFFTLNDGLKFGDFEVKDNALYFNGKLLALQSNIDLSEDYYDGVIGIVSQNSNLDTQEIKLNGKILGIENVTAIKIDIWDNGGQYRDLAVTYNATNNSLEVTESAVATVLSNAYSGNVILPCKIVTAYSTYWAKIQLLGYNRTATFISTKAELEASLTATNFVSNSVFVLINDIDGAVIENKSNSATGVSPVFDGRGHAITNATIKGYGLLGNYFSGEFKNTIVTVASVQTETKGLITGQSANSTIKNVYIEGDVTGSVAESVFRNVYGSCHFVNVITNVKGASDVINGTAATETNVVSVGDNFFTENATLKFGSFEVKTDGLYFAGKKVLAK